MHDPVPTFYDRDGVVGCGLKVFESAMLLAARQVRLHLNILVVSGR
jgi:hypothetical protein